MIHVCNDGDIAYFFLLHTGMCNKKSEISETINIMRFLSHEEGLRDRKAERLPHFVYDNFYFSIIL